MNDTTETLTVTPLGSGQEVGRSCHYLTYKESKVLLDCGIHPGYSGVDGLPFFDRIEPSEVEVLLITHFHLDHAAALPHFTERTGFKGRIFMTHPTKAVIKLLLTDYLRLMSINSADKPDEDVLYTEEELKSCLDKVELIDYHSVHTVNNIKFWALNAGHVLGACMYMIEIGGRTILYTGDYSMEEDRHLMAAELPATAPDVLIVESTYGVQVHPTRQEREGRFTSTVDRIVSRGGRCLIPVFALGRAQELLLILDEYWQANPHLHQVPVWYASKLASKALRVYQTYVNMMNIRVRQSMDLGNPFKFKYIQNLKSIDVNSFDDRGPSVVFASPGMLQSGVSRRLFDRWCTDPKNGVVIAGYAVENTLAKDLQKEPEQVMSLEGKMQQRNLHVETVSFSAHVDFVQNRDFITKVAPGHIVFVHGSGNEMSRLRNAMKVVFNKYPEDKRPTLAMPGNCVPVRLPFAQRKEAKVLGRLAGESTSALKEGDELRGVLFTHNFQTRVCAPEDLPTYTQLRVGAVKAILHVPFVGSVETLRLFLNEMFDSTTEYDEGEGGVTFGLHGDNVKITSSAGGNTVKLAWAASPVNDMLADACVALIMHAQSSAASIRITSKPCFHEKEEEEEEEEEEGGGRKKSKVEESPKEVRLRMAKKLLDDLFKDVEADMEKGIFTVKCEVNKEKEDVVCVVTLEFSEDNSGCRVSVDCADEQQGGLVKDCIMQLGKATAPFKVDK